MLTLRISDMTCGHCASTIARAVSGVDKSARVEVDISEKQVSVTSTADDCELIEAIQEAGYTPEKVSPAPAARPRPRTGSGCGCGCGSGAASPVDVAQRADASGDACCRKCGA
jgi:copper chaperone